MSDGDDGKRDGMARAERHADQHWWICTLGGVKTIAEQHPFFHTDAVVLWCRQHHPNATTHEMRALGPLMREAARLGYCERTDHWAESTQPQCHSRPMRVWYSLIYRGPSVPKPRRRAPVYDPRKHTLGGSAAVAA